MILTTDSANLPSILANVGPKACDTSRASPILTRPMTVNAEGPTDINIPVFEFDQYFGKYFDVFCEHDR